MVQGLSAYLRGWHGYFGFRQTPSVLAHLDKWLRRRLRSVLWKQWKRGRTRFAELRKRGIRVDLAARTAGSAHGPWRLAASSALSLRAAQCLLRLPQTSNLAALARINPPNRRMRTRMSGGVAGARG